MRTTDERAGRAHISASPDDQPPVVVGAGVKGERSESKGHEVPLTPVPETTLLDQPGEADNLTTMKKETVMEKLLLSPEEVAEMLGVGRSRVYDLMRKRELLSVRIGKSRRVPTAALQEYVKGLTENAWVA